MLSSRVVTNPYDGHEPYKTAWQHGHDYGRQNRGSEQPDTPDFSGWGYDAATTKYIDQVWQEGALAGREEASQAWTPEQTHAAIERNFQGWMSEGNYELAAQELNGFSLPEIYAHLDALAPEKVALLHHGAVSNTKVGRLSNAGLATGVDIESNGISWWQHHPEVVEELAKHAGLHGVEQMVGTLAGEEAGHFTGVLGLAVELAMVPGSGIQYHAVYCACEPDNPFQPVSWEGSDRTREAIWHAKRENAQRDADEYAAVTGRHAVVTEGASKDADPD